MTPSTPYSPEQPPDDHLSDDTEPSAVTEEIAVVDAQNASSSESRPSLLDSLSSEERRSFDIQREAMTAALRDSREPEARTEEAEPYVAPTFTGTYRHRFHVFDMFLLVVVGPLMIVVVWALLFFAGAFIVQVLDNLMYTGSVPFEDWLRLWLPLLAGIALCGWAAWQAFPQYIEWRYTWLIITEQRVLLRCKVPGKLLNMITNIDDYEEGIPRAAVLNIRVAQTWLGELLGYADVKFETSVQLDERFSRLAFVSHPKEIQKLFLSE